MGYGPSMSTLSLAMIVKDEETALGHCLGSVRGLVDEMVVVDTGSTDRTVAIAESFGARIGRFPWIDDFAAARNESLRLCTGDWVLVLDADEAVDVLDHARIRQAIQQDAVAGFNLVSRNYSRSGHFRVFDQPVVPNRSAYGEGAEFPYYLDLPGLRLVRRFPDLSFRGRIHENLEPYFRVKKLPIGTLEAVIHHFGKLDGAREEAKKAYYLELAEREASLHPGDAHCQFYLLCQAHLAGQWEKAVTAGLAVLRLAPAAQIPTSVPVTLGMALQELGRHGEALPHLVQVLQAEPGHPLALSRLSVSLMALGRTGEARSHLQQAIAANPRDPAPYVALCDLEEKAGQGGLAREALRQAIQLDPSDPRLRQCLVELDLRLRLDAQAAADAMEALRDLPAMGDGHWHALAAGFLLRSGHVRPGKAVLDLGLASFPDHEGLRRLAAALQG